MGPRFCARKNRALAPTREPRNLTFNGAALLCAEKQHITRWGKSCYLTASPELSVGQHSLYVLAFSLQVGESLHALDQDLYQH